MIKTKNIFTLILFGTATVVLALNYPHIKETVINAGMMWCTAILPSVFPYLILSQYLNDNLSFSEKTGIFKTVMKKLLKTNSAGINVFFTSLFCGYPSGALAVADLYPKKALSLKNAQRLICFTNNAGPLFLISAVGTSMLKNTRDGIALYIIQLISCVCYAIISPSSSKNEEILTHKCNTIKDKNNICGYISKAITTVISAGGFIITASIICELIIIILTPLISPLSSGFTQLIKTGIYFLLELSSASFFISQTPETTIRFAILSASVSWSGICVFWQIKSVLPEEIKILPLIKAKFIQSVISFVCGYIYKTFSVQHNIQSNNCTFMLASLIISAVLFVYYLIFQRKKI